MCLWLIFLGSTKCVIGADQGGGGGFAWEHIVCLCYQTQLFIGAYISLFCVEVVKIHDSKPAVCNFISYSV